MTVEFFNAVRPMFGGKITRDQVAGCQVIREASEGLPISHRAYLLATAFLETARTMQPITEYGPVSYFNKYEPGTRIGNVLGNTRKGDGYRYRGHGYVQLTGRDNFERASRKLNVDLVSKPSLALRPDIAARILVMGCSEGWFTGKKLSDYLPGDYKQARRVVNGLDRATAIASYARIFERALATVPVAKPPAQGIAAFFAAIAEFFRKLFG